VAAAPATRPWRRWRGGLGQFDGLLGLGQLRFDFSLCCLDPRARLGSGCCQLGLPCHIHLSLDFSQRVGKLLFVLLNSWRGGWGFGCFLTAHGQCVRRRQEGGSDDAGDE